MNENNPANKPANFDPTKTTITPPVQQPVAPAKLPGTTEPKNAMPGTTQLKDAVKSST
jgi:hypothetical protein